MSMPSDLIPFAQYIEKNNKKHYINKIVTGGEALNNNHRTYLKSVFGDVLFGSTYQAMDYGTIGYQSGDCDIGEYWIQNHLHLAEILDDVDAPININEEGELVLTNFTRHLMPVIRVRTGDMVRLLDVDPIKGLKIKHLGRKGNIIKIGGEKFNTNIIKQVLNDINIPSTYQMIVTLKDNRDHICIKLLNSNHMTIEDAKNKINHSIESSFPKFKNMLRHNIINDVEYSFVEDAGFIKSRSSGKIINIIDKRGE